MKFKRWMAVILSVLLVWIFAAAAFAEEGGFQEPPPQEGGDVVGPSGDDPVDPGPGDNNSDPSSDPEPSGPDGNDPDSSDPGGDDPNSSDPGGDDPESSDPGGDDPESSDPGDGEGPIGPIEPSGDDPVTPSPEPYNPGITGGGTTGGTASSSAPPRTPSGQGIRQPSLSPGVRATPKPASSGQPEEPEDLEPNYITFARLSQKNNSMSIVLFYSGASCVAVGLLGLLTLAVFIVRGRRLDQREGIFEEIEQAETRRSPAAATRRRTARKTPPPPQPQYEPDPDPASYQPYNPGYQDARQPLHHPEPEELAMPVNGSLYTEEFEIPAQAYQQDHLQQEYLQQEYLPQGRRQPGGPAPAPSASLYTEEFELPVQRPAPPPQASMYTEEFSIPEPGRRPAANPPSRRPGQSSGAGYDTNELLRELLDGEENRR